MAMTLDAYLQGEGIQEPSGSSSEVLAADSVSSWLDAIEIRAGADDADNARQTLSLRLHPKAFGQGDAERSILELRDRQLQLEKARNRGIRLKQRYLHALDLLQGQQQLRLLQARQKLTATEIRFLHGLSSTEDFRPAELLLAEMRQQQLQQELQMQQQGLRQLQQSLNVELQEQESLLSVAEILVLVRQEQEDVQQSPELAEGQLRLQLAYGDLALEEARQGQGFSLIEYKVERNDRGPNVNNFTLGWEIPLSGSRFDVAEKQRRITEATTSLHRRKAELLARQQSIRLAVAQQQAQDALIGQSLAEVEKRVRQTARLKDVKLIVALEKERLRLLEKRAEVHQRALSLLVEYLDDSGLLARQPLRNWLRPGDGG